MRNIENRRAWKVGAIGGKPVYRVPVVILENSSRACETLRRREFTVLAWSAPDAANWARDNECDNRPETEVYAFGPKGGEAYRYIGWESAIGRAMEQQWDAPKQLTLTL